ncbi:MAG: chromosome segregation protein SMC [bacterium]|nr:chromosome segregation protein SMC [bacterium]MDE0287204.1 chromosome segregation protein SMC [bacterium]MDE0437141.1 chromosome segregation protein SMC [bacterium]
MYLKSLRLAGFKSFADRTGLEFEPGVSVVVGPNGTGKSNIVDSLAWVLGTQFTRALRTDRMEDVIFAGTATRPAHSRAEVTVMLDNRDRALPLDLDEVSLTRRLFRGGRSDYEINGVRCRLLDVQDLLSDSGVGRSQHLIVGQGRLESLLTAKGDERRRIIEEAAGILKHQVRKARALQRLERTDADLLRLHDIVAEIKRRKRPLRRQAAAAERHESMRAELKALHLWLGGVTLRRSRQRSRELSLERTRLEETSATGRSRLVRLEETLAGMERERSQQARSLARDAGAAARLDTVSARLRGIAQVARERRRGLVGRIEQATVQRTSLDRQIDRLVHQLEEADGREQDAGRQVEATEANLRASAEQLQGPPAPEDADPVMLRDDLRSLETAAARDAREFSKLTELLEGTTARADADRSRAKALERELDRTRERTAAARKLRESSSHALAARNAQWERSDRLLREARSGRAAAEAKAEALTAAASRSWRPLKERLTDLGGVAGVLTALLDPPDVMAAAVDAAVGEWAEAVVLDGPDRLRRAVSIFKSEGLGGLPLMAGPTGEAGIPLAPTIARQWGVDALVDRLGPGADPELARSLLGDVVLVEGWSTGWDIVAHEPRVRAVTPDGDLITSLGVRTADQDRSTAATLEAARNSAEAAREAETAARQAEEDARRELAAARDAAARAHDDLAALESAGTKAETELDRLGRAEASGGDAIAGIELRVAALRRTIEQRKGRVAALRERIADAETEDGEARAERRRERDAAERAHATAHNARDAAIRELGAAVERRHMLRDRIDRLAARREALHEAPSGTEQLEETRTVEEMALQVLEVVRVKLAEVKERCEYLRASISDQDGLLATTRTEISEVETTVTGVRERLGRIDVEQTELRMREESVAEGLRRDADASVQQALAAERPLTEGEEPTARAERLGAQLAAMGPVNLLATDEFRELDERHRLMTDQLADLERSKADLNKVILSLDAEMQELFNRTFEDTARHYRRFFTVLFPGGTGELVLTGADEPLEAGVEIVAQPLGKKIGKLALLSGGERSLAALAFLFAVFEARPAPFYILDEVDAALDDANLHRFLRLVDEFRDHAQLIVVTHQQATVRAADILYGVTMEPGGSSKAFVHRMDEAVIGA